MNQFSDKKLPSRKHNWIGWTWAILYLVLLAAVILGPGTEELCHQMGVDFRGYYASGQIIRAHGFAAVYNQELQRETQAELLFGCSSPSTEKPLYVAMPYLPLFAVLFIPFTYLPFPASYLLWAGLQLGLFFWTLHHFNQSFGGRKGIFQILQWGISLPLIANLYLGQINALLVLLFSQFVVSSWKGQYRLSGVWLSTLLIKPHTLILLLPGLVLRKNSSILLSFCLSTAAVLGSSLILAGFDGLEEMIRLTYQFAGPLIQNPAGMMNWRALGLNLEVLIPSWLGWVLAAALAILVVWKVLHPWRKMPLWSTGFRQWVGLMGITLVGTFIISWHSHFYMQMLLVPLLLVLDSERLLPNTLRLTWLIGPPLVYLTVHLAVPASEGSFLGLFMLLLNIYVLWGIEKLVLHHGDEFSLRTIF